MIEFFDNPLLLSLDLTHDMRTETVSFCLRGVIDCCELVAVSRELLEVESDSLLTFIVVLDTKIEFPILVQSEWLASPCLLPTSEELFRSD